MSLTDPHLTTLADHFGIARDYYDWKGQHTEVGKATVIAAVSYTHLTLPTILRV